MIRVDARRRAMGIIREKIIQEKFESKLFSLSKFDPEGEPLRKKQTEIFQDLRGVFKTINPEVSLLLAKEEQLRSKKQKAAELEQLEQMSYNESTRLQALETIAASKLRKNK